MQPLRSEHKEDTDWLHDLPSSVPSLRATNSLCMKLARRRTGVSSCSADHMTRSSELGLILIGIGIDRHPSLRFSHGHPRYLDISSAFNLRIIPPFRMCSNGYQRNKTVLKNGDSRLAGSLDWPRRTRDLNRPVPYSKHWNSNTVRCSHSFCGSHFW
ncbi:BQ5605_C012g06807 [Microbotryum silenes-dioicae]|uniref:BQ5605_C012g06807 protein n=1 Tax=Microbotryum silenes-dioicae TaxID=796604 RepID=A0A2X0MDH1_9BASI|nr:BQ5605_C012g06807 [Microbotryum silenes-dioicae]